VAGFCELGGWSEWAGRVSERLLRSSVHLSLRAAAYVEGGGREVAQAAKLTHPRMRVLLLPGVEGRLTHLQLPTNVAPGVPLSVWRSA